MWIMKGFFIGRFQPFHLGHFYAMQFALSKVDMLWVGIGSSNKKNEKRNPFSAIERKQMILSSINKTLLRRIKIYLIPDFDDHAKWIDAINYIVPKYDLVFSNDEITTSICSKTSNVSTIRLHDRKILSGTNIRNKMISGDKWEELVPAGTKKVLRNINLKERLSIL